MIMAHQLTREQIDQAAAADAATVKQQLPPAADTPTPEPILGRGDTGEPVTKLVQLLALLGYVTNDIIKGAPPVLDESVLVDVRAAQLALGVTEPPDPTGVELVGEVTWAALYDAAEAKLEAAKAASVGGTASAAAASGTGTASTA
jgi:hypothetical protein